MADNEEAAAKELTKFLIEPERYSGKSHLLKVVEKKISEMTLEIADAVLAETPEIAERVTTLTRQVVTQVLRDDAWLSSTVTGAVAKAMGQIVRSREEDGE